MKEYVFEVSAEFDGERVDKALALMGDFLSRAYIQKQIKAQRVFAAGVPVKASYRLAEGDEIRIEVPENAEPDIEPENIALDILYEDDDILIVNKPKGMVVHPAPGHYTGTLVNAVLYHCRGTLSGINGVLRPGIVHRIDKDTTGSLIVCKNDKAHVCVAEQLKEHSITRIYHAICSGVLSDDEGTIDTMLGRDPKDRKKMAIVKSGGKHAVTHYKVLRRFRGCTYIECRLETGRTHQIRAHMAGIGHPLLGDIVYHAPKNVYHLEGQTLHAKTIGLRLPGSGEYLEVDAPLPEYFAHLLEVL